MKKQVGLYEVDAIDNAMIAVNPKKYFEKYDYKNINKMPKGMRKDDPGLSFDVYASQIMSLHEYETIGKIPQQKVQKRFQVKKWCYEND